MLGPVEDLLARSHTDLPPAAASQLEVVNRNGFRLLRLVNTLLDFSRIEAGCVRPSSSQPISPPSQPISPATSARRRMRRLGCSSTAHPCPSRCISTAACGKIVLNLLSTHSNSLSKAKSPSQSVKPAGASKSPCEHRYGYPRRGALPLVPAIPPDRERQGPNARRQRHRTGLVQELVKLHGDRFHAQSSLGQGSTFTVELLVGRSHLPAEQIGVHRRASAKPDEAACSSGSPRWLPGETADVEQSRPEPSAVHATGCFFRQFESTKMTGRACSSPMTTPICGIRQPPARRTISGRDCA